MNRLTLFAVTACLSAVAFAQSPLTSTFASNNGGSVGGGVYFDLTAVTPLTVTGLDLNFGSAASTAGSVEIWTISGTRVGSQTNQALWTLAATGTAVSNGTNIPTPVTLSGPIALPVGTTGIAIKAIGLSHRYTNTTPTSGSTAELSFAAGEASNVAFAGSLFSPRIANFNIYYATGSGTLATRAPYGNRGGREFASVYENFASPATFDLNGVDIEFNEQAGGGWQVGPGTGPVSTATATSLTLTDDSEVTQALSSGFAASVNICSNGFVSVGGSNGTGFTPAIATLLGAANEAWWVWHDLNPGAAGSGAVKYEFIGGEDVITYDGVFEFASTTPQTFQLRLSGTPGSRRVGISFVSISGVGNAVLVGYSPGGASADPGNRDISASGALTLSATDIAGLGLAASARPVIGTSFNLDTSNIRPASVVCAVNFGFGQDLAGLDLTSIGAQNNWFYLSSADFFFVPSIVGSGASQPVSVPNDPGLIGIHVYVQSFTITPGANSAGLLTSNGVDLVLGDL